MFPLSWPLPPFQDWIGLKYDPDHGVIEYSGIRYLRDDPILGVVSVGQRFRVIVSAFLDT